MRASFDVLCFHEPADHQCFLSLSLIRHVVRGRALSLTLRNIKHLAQLRPAEIVAVTQKKKKTKPWLASSISLVRVASVSPLLWLASGNHHDGRSGSPQYCLRSHEVRLCLSVLLTSPSRSRRAKCVPCGPDLRGVRLVGGAYPFPNLPPLLSHRELCPGTAPAHLPAPPQRLPAWQGTESPSQKSCACNSSPLFTYRIRPSFLQCCCR